MAVLHNYIGMTERKISFPTLGGQRDLNIIDQFKQKTKSIFPYLYPIERKSGINLIDSFIMSYICGVGVVMVSQIVRQYD